MVKSGAAGFDEPQHIKLASGAISDQERCVGVSRGETQTHTYILALTLLCLTGLILHTPEFHTAHNPI